MDAKHQFKYTYKETDLEEYSPHEITFEMPGYATLDQMLYNFQSYLKACGFVFDGELEIVDHTFDVMKDQDNVNEIYGCMADFDRACGCESTSSPLETSEFDKQFDVTRTTASSKEVVKNNWVHGMCNPPSPDWKKQK